jgi:NAD(P)H-hydrate epimerase
MKPLPLELNGALPSRASDASKYSVGTVTVVGSCGRYIHAPVIAALGSRCAGAGLVQLVVPDASRIAAGALVPEATFTKLVATCVPPKADVTVIGMGLGVSVSTEVIVSRLLSGSSGRFVLDADALNLLAAELHRLPAAQGPVIITPHPGEMARLCGKTVGEIRQDRIGTAGAFAAKYRVITVLKGAGTVTASPSGQIFVNRTGNPGMARGGSGDVLAGMTGALLAGGMEPVKAAYAAVCLHGAAGDRCAEKLSETAMLPTDLIETLPEVFRALEKLR